MQITLKSLELRDACEDGLDWFKENFGIEADSEQIIKKLREIKCTKNWMWWLFVFYELGGRCDDWYNNGSLRYCENYKNGKLHGLCEGWYKSGEYKYHNNWENGKKHGLCEQWYDNEEYEHRENYKNGELISKGNFT